MFNKLAEFYKAYSDWIDAGAQEGDPFSRRVGLCASLCLYLKGKGCNPREREVALFLMKSQFTKAGLSRDYRLITQITHTIWNLLTGKSTPTRIA